MFHYSSAQKLCILICILALGACSSAPREPRGKIMHCFLLSEDTDQKVQESWQGKLVISNSGKKPIIFQNNGYKSDLSKIWLSIGSKANSPSSAGEELALEGEGMTQNQLILPAYSSSTFNFTHPLKAVNQNKSVRDLKHVHFNIRTDTHGFLSCAVKR